MDWHRNGNFANMGEGQGFPLEKGETQCLVLTASRELPRGGARVPGDR